MKQLYYGSAVTISTTEISLVSGTSSLQNDTTAGIFMLLLDTAAMAAGDTFRITVKEKIISGGTQRSFEPIELVGAQTSPLRTIYPLYLMWGWDITIIKIAGTARAFSWSIRQDDSTAVAVAANAADLLLVKQVLGLDLTYPVDMGATKITVSGVEIDVASDGAGGYTLTRVS